MDWAPARRDSDHGRPGRSSGSLCRGERPDVVLQRLEAPRGPEAVNIRGVDHRERDQTAVVLPGELCAEHLGFTPVNTSPVFQKGTVPGLGVAGGDGAGEQIEAFGLEPQVPVGVLGDSLVKCSVGIRLSDSEPSAGRRFRVWSPGEVTAAKIISRCMASRSPLAVPTGGQLNSPLADCWKRTVTAMARRAPAHSARSRALRTQPTTRFLRPAEGTPGTGAPLMALARSASRGGGAE